MKFEHDGKTYVLEFTRRYRQIQVPYPLPKQTRKAMGRNSIKKTQRSKYFYTTLDVFEVEATGPTKILLPSTAKVFRTYTVGCSHLEDQRLLSKRGLYEEGRKAALRGVTRGNSLTKEFKRKIWDAYLNRPRTQSTRPGFISKPVQLPIVDGEVSLVREQAGNGLSDALG